MQLLPEVDYGFGQVFEFDVKLPVYAGDADSSGSGDVQISLQWQVLDEEKGAPFSMSIEP